MSLSGHSTPQYQLGRAHCTGTDTSRVVSAPLCVGGTDHLAVDTETTENDLWPGQGRVDSVGLTLL